MGKKKNREAATLIARNEFAVSEAKDHLNAQIVAIRETRNKMFVILGTFIAIIGGVSTDFYSGNYSSTMSFNLYISVLFAVIVVVICYKSINPKSLRFNGIIPEKLNTVVNCPQKDYYEALLETYNKSISKNGEVLENLSTSYKHMFNCIIIHLLVLTLFNVFQIFT